MKVAFTVPTAKRDNAYITMENQDFTVKSVMSLTNSCQMTDDGIVATFYLNINKTVQGAGDNTASIRTPSASFETLGNDKMDVYNNFQKVTVSKFKKGVTYLIPSSQYAPLPMIPNFEVMPVGGTNTVFVADHFLYKCPEDSDILNATSIQNCITVEVNGVVAEAITQTKAVTTATQDLNYLSAIGVPSAIASVDNINSLN